MPEPSPRANRPAAPSLAAHSVDQTGLQSIRVDLDSVDDLNLLAASLQANHLTPIIKPVNAKQSKIMAGSARSILIPPLLTGGAICEALAIAWFLYRRRLALSSRSASLYRSS